MSKYASYRSRVAVSGETMQDAFRNSTKRQQVSYFMDSPSISHVKVNLEEETTPCIVSDIDTFKKRKFLFLPDYVINSGTYIEHQNFTYLITEHTLDDIYPQATGELCNDDFKLVTGTEKVKVDEDAFGRPIYDIIETFELFPCVLSTKTYSTAENNAIPLPDGTMLIKIPYHPEKLVQVNYVIEKRRQQYQITSVSYENVINEVGFVEIRLQRVVSGNES